MIGRRLRAAVVAVALGVPAAAGAQTSGGPLTLSVQTPGGPFLGSAASEPLTPGTLPLALADAVERGLKYNLGLLSIEDQVESARGARMRSLKELLPRVDARAGEVRQTTNLAAFGFDPSLFPGMPSIVGPFNIFDARVAGSGTLFDLSAVNDLRSKTAALNAVRFDARNARELVTFVVTNLYFQAVAGASRIDTARSQVSTADALLTLATNMRNAGASPGIDVVRAQVQLQAQRQRLISAENQFAKQTIDLARAIGLPTAQAVDLVDRNLTLTAPSLTTDDAVKQALASRPDYQAGLERVHAAEAALQSAKTTALPSVRVSADYGAIGPSAADARRTYSMSASVRMPLYDPDRAGREVENAAALRQRQAEATDLAQRIEAEVRTSFLDVQAAEQQLAVATERLALTNQELSLAQVRFSAGVTSNLEVIQAQNEVAVATELEITAKYAVNVARAALTRAVGGPVAPQP